MCSEGFVCGPGVYPRPDGRGNAGGVCFSDRLAARLAERSVLATGSAIVCHQRPINPGRGGLVWVCRVRVDVLVR